MHFPPYANNGTRTEFIELLEDYSVDIVIYGHLHGEHRSSALVGDFWGMYFQCVSCDLVDFTPVHILDLYSVSEELHSEAKGNA